MTETIIKIAFMLFVLQNDGTVKSSVRIVEDCPPEQYVTLAMEEKIKKRQIKGWAASCQGVVFEIEQEMQL